MNLQPQGSGNLKLQGMSNIFAYEDKIRAFIAKIELWINKVERKNFSAFDTFNQIIDGQGADIKEEIQKNMMLHLTNLKSEFNRYFLDCEDKSIQKLIGNPLIVNVSEVSDEIQEEVIEMQHETNLKDTFESGINLKIIGAKSNFFSKASRHCYTLPNFIFIDVSMRAGVFAASDYEKQASKSVVVVNYHKTSA